MALFNSSSERPLRSPLTSLLIFGAALLSTFILKPLLSGGEEEVPAVSGAGLQAYFLDVDQGDSTLLICDGMTMLIDAGLDSQGETVVDNLGALGVEKLDYVVCTHPHADHMGGLHDVVNAFPVDTVWCCVDSYDSGAFEKFEESVHKRGAEIEVPEMGGTVQLGEAQISVLGPLDTYDDLNEMSLILRVRYGENTMLLMGDAGIPSEDDMLDAGVNLSCNLLRVGHHGSSGSTGYRLLYEAAPDIAVISCGIDNEYGHPHEETMSRLADADVAVYRTDELGIILARSDGQQITIEAVSLGGEGLSQAA